MSAVKVRYTGIEEDVAGELMELSGGGDLDVNQLVGWAQDHPGSALHSRLEWDDTKAGHAHRLWQMRQIVARVRIVIEDREERSIRAFVSIDTPEVGRRYVTAQKVASDKVMREQHVRNLKARAKAWSIDARQFDEFSEVVAAIDSFES
jgi:hypothetical protein